MISLIVRCMKECVQLQRELLVMLLDLFFSRRAAQSKDLERVVDSAALHLGGCYQAVYKVTE